MKLSKRLQAVVAMISKGNTLADIGTDHGYIPIYMALNNLTSHAIAMDVNQGPLERAINNIEKYKVESIVSTRLSNGLEKLRVHEVDTILIAGMGGLLTIRILSEYLKIAHSAKELVLSPHSDVEMVRKYLVENKFLIKDEAIVFDEGKYYFIIKAVQGSMAMPEEIDLLFSKKLLERQDSTLKKYLLKELDKKQNIFNKLTEYGQENTQRIMEIQREMSRIKEALARYENL